MKINLWKSNTLGELLIDEDVSLNISSYLCNVCFGEFFWWFSKIIASLKKFENLLSTGREKVHISFLNKGTFCRTENHVLQKKSQIFTFFLMQGIFNMTKYCLIANWNIDVFSSGTRYLWKYFMIFFWTENIWIIC